MLPITMYWWTGVIRNRLCRPSARPVARSTTTKNRGSGEAVTPASHTPEEPGEPGDSSGM